MKNKIGLVKTSLALATSLLITGCGNVKQSEPQKSEPQTSMEQITDTEGTTIEEISQETSENSANKEEQTSQNNTTANKEEQATQNNSTPSKEEQTTENKVSAEKTTNKYTTTTTRTTTKANSVNKQPTTTTKITNKQTTTTTKPTPIQPTTTKEQTKPPVQQPSEYKIEDIATDRCAFDYYAGALNFNLMQGNGKTCTYASVTYGSKESLVALAILNDGLISDEILKDIFKYYTIDDFKHGAEYIYSMCNTEKLFGTDIDFCKYTIDKEIGNYLNDLDNSYRSGNAEAFIYDKFINGNISNKCVSHVAVWALSCSYDIRSKYLTVPVVEVEMMEEYINKLNKTVHGKSYTR